MSEQDQIKITHGDESPAGGWGAVKAGVKHVLKEKALAALRVGTPHVIIPEQNQKELVEIPQDIRRRMNFHPVKDMDEVIGLAFKKPEKAKRRKMRRAAV